MRKIFTHFFAMMMLLLSVNTLSAQTIVWPTADSSTILASQFADSSQIFWSKTANPPANFKGWVTKGITSGDPAKKDSAIWVWTPDGRGASGSLWGTRLGIASLSAANGAAIFNSDFLSSSGRAPEAHSGDLISPTINATGYKNLTLRFTQYYRSFVDDVLVSWSEDGGVTWKDTVSVQAETFFSPTVTLLGQGLTGNPSGVTTFGETSRADVIQVRLPGSVGTANFKVKFTFQGDGYFWIIDDVQLRSYQNNLQTNENFFAIPANLVTPKGQTEPIRFLTDVSNQGDKTQTNVKLNVTVRNNKDLSLLHTGDFSYGSLKSDTIAENQLMPNSYTPVDTGVYVGRYKLSSDSTDQYTPNDSTRFVFAVSDSVFQKESGGVLSTRPADGLWGTGAAHNWKIGNYFYVVKGKNMKATKITGRIGNGAALVGKKLNAYLYRWKQTVKRSTRDTIKAAELFPVGFGEITLPTGFANFGVIDIPISNVEDGVAGEIIKLKDTTAYIAMIDFTTTSASTAADGNMTMTFDTRYDYGAMKLATKAAGKSRHAAIFGIGSSEDLYTDLFGSNYIPVVRLTLGQIPTATKDVLAGENKFKIYPNPSSASIVNLDIDLVKAAAVTIRVSAIDGKIINEQTFDNIQKDQVELNVNNFINGTYFVQLISELGTRTEKLIINK